MNEGYKCKDCPNCPYYERVTSYGTEEIRCGNYITGINKKTIWKRYHKGWSSEEILKEG